MNLTIPGSQIKLLLISYKHHTVNIPWIRYVGTNISEKYKGYVPRHIK